MELLSPKTLVLIAADGSGGGYSQIPEREKGLSLLWPLALRSTGSGRADSAAMAPQHVGSSRTRAQTCVPCIGRRTLNHCATREALGCFKERKYT